MIKKEAIIISIIITAAIFATIGFIIEGKQKFVKKQLTSVADTVYDFSLSPNGAKIALVKQESYGKNKIYNIWAMDSDGNNWKQLTNGTVDVWFREPVWSPDGTKIAFVSILTSKMPINEIRTMDGDGRNKKKLVSEKGSISKLSWSPDGKHFAYLENGKIISLTLK